MAWVLILVGAAAFAGLSMMAWGGKLGFAAIGIGFLGSPQVFVRYISMKDEKQILPGTLTAVTWTLLADSGAVFVGMFGRALFGVDEIGGNADNILPTMALELLPAFVSGLFIAMVLSAIMSTIDSLLVVASSAGVRDYWQKKPLLIRQAIEAGLARPLASPAPATGRCVVRYVFQEADCRIAVTTTRPVRRQMRSAAALQVLKSIPPAHFIF